MTMQSNDDSPRPSNRVGVLSVIIVAVALTAICAGWFYFAVASPSKFQPIVDSLTSGPLKAAPSGMVSTANDFAGVVVRDEIFITRRSDGSLLALFPTYRNKGTDIGGLLYTSRPLRDADTYPQAAGLNIDKRRIDVGGQRKLNIDKRIDANWYRVSYGLE